MSFKKKDQEAIAKLVMEMNKPYNEGSYPREPSGDTFDDALYRQISDLVYKMKGKSVDDVKQQISDQLDVRLDNMYGSKLEQIFYKLYDSVNGTRNGQDPGM